jgi:hypothetical protein
MAEMDWQQVVLNGGPPCFALLDDEPDRYCGRAERWAGHDGEHEFVSLADLLAKTRAPEWRPIESAPKDGTAILIYGPELLREIDGHCAVARWQATGSNSIAWWTISEGKCGPFDLRGPSPTHWMPLPAPPEVKQ